MIDIDLLFRYEIDLEKRTREFIFNYSNNARRSSFYKIFSIFSGNEEKITLLINIIIIVL